MAISYCQIQLFLYTERPNAKVLKLLCLLAAAAAVLVAEFLADGHDLHLFFISLFFLNLFIPIFATTLQVKKCVI